MTVPTTFLFLIWFSNPIYFTYFFSKGGLLSNKTTCGDPSESQNTEQWSFFSVTGLRGAGNLALVFPLMPSVVPEGPPDSVKVTDVGQPLIYSLNKQFLDYFYVIF